MNKKVSIVIINLNTREILKLCLKNLLEIERNYYSNMEIIVVDAASFDGSQNMVRTEFPTVTLVETDNYGLADNLNKGLEKASGDYILYLGADAFPKPNTIEKLVNVMCSDEKIGALSAKLILRSGEIDMDCHRGFPTAWTSFCHFLSLDKLFPNSKIFAKYFMTYKNLETTHEIDMGIAHFLMIRKSTHNSVGIWDREYPVFGEDVDMCYRIKNAGWKIVYVHDAVAEHWKGVNVGRKETKDIKLEDVTYRLRDKNYNLKQLRTAIKSYTTLGMKLFYKKHLAKNDPILVRFIVLTAIYLLEKIRVIKYKLS